LRELGDEFDRIKATLDAFLAEESIGEAVKAEAVTRSAVFSAWAAVPKSCYTGRYTFGDFRPAANGKITDNSLICLVGAPGIEPGAS